MPEPVFEEPLPPPLLEPVKQPAFLPIGWIFTGFLLFIWIVIAVGEYATSEGAARNFDGLQNQLRYEISLKSSSVPGAEKMLGESVRDGLTKILDEAEAEAGKSDEAARIAVVTARELKKEPNSVAMKRLRESKVETSNLIYAINEGGEAQRQDVDALSEVKSNEFAVRLALTQARESLGEKNARQSLVDSNLVIKLGVIMVGVLFAVIAGIVCLILFIDARKKGKWVAVGISNLTKSDGDRYASRFAFYLLAFTVLGIGGAYYTKYVTESLWTGVVVFIATIVVTILFFQVRIGNIKDTLKSIVGKTNEVVRLIGQGLYGYLTLLPFLLVALVFASVLTPYFPQPSHPIDAEIRNAFGTDWLALFLTAAVLAPIIEELMFRGLLFPALTTITKRPLWAMMISGFLFAAIHPQGPLIWPALMSVGVVASYLRYHTGSIIPSIVLHMVHNGLLITFSYLIK